MTRFNVAVRDPRSILGDKVIYSHVFSTEWIGYDAYIDRAQRELVNAFPAPKYQITRTDRDEVMKTSNVTGD